MPRESIDTVDALKVRFESADQSVIRILQRLQTTGRGSGNFGKAGDVATVEAGLRKLATNASTIADKMDTLPTTPRGTPMNLETMALSLEERLQRLEIAERRELETKAQIVEERLQKLEIADRRELQTMARTVEDRMQKLENAGSVQDDTAVRELDAKRMELEAMARNLEARVQKLTAYKITTLPTIVAGDGSPTMADCQQLETMARTLEDRLQEIEDGGSAPLRSDEESKSQLYGIAKGLQQRITELEQLQVVLDGSALQKTANDLVVRLELLEKSQGGEVPVVRPAAPVAQPAAPEINARVQILESRLAASEEEKEILRRELVESKQKTVPVVQPIVQPAAPDPEAISQIKHLESSIVQLRDALAASEEEKKQLRFGIYELQNTVVPQTVASEPNPDAIARVGNLEKQIAAQNDEKTNLILQLQTSTENANSTRLQLQEIIEKQVVEVDAAQRDAQEAKKHIIQLENQLKAREEQDLQQINRLAELDAKDSQAVRSLQSELANCSQEKVKMKIDHDNSLRTSNDKSVKLESQIVQLQSLIEKIGGEEMMLASQAILATEVATEALLHPQDPRVPELMNQIEGLNSQVTLCQQRLVTRDSEKVVLERELKDANVSLRTQDRSISELRQTLEQRDKRILELSEQKRMPIPSGQVSPEKESKPKRVSTSPVSPITSPTKPTFAPVSSSPATRRPVTTRSPPPATTVRPSASIASGERTAATVRPSASTLGASNSATTRPTARPTMRTRQPIPASSNLPSSQSRLQALAKRQA